MDRYVTSTTRVDIIHLFKPENDRVISNFKWHLHGMIQQTMRENILHAEDNCLAWYYKSLHGANSFHIIFSETNSSNLVVVYFK